MDPFQTGYDPSEWDLVSNRSDGEYLSLTEDSDSSLDPPQSTPVSDSDSDTSQVEEALNFLDIKMMTPYIDLNSLLHQRYVLEAKMSSLSPEQFQLFDLYASQIAHLTDQINAIQQPSVVNIHHYTPTDAEFIHPTKQDNKVKEKGKNLATFPEPIQDESLDNTIFHLEESIREKEALVQELWKSMKLQKEELEYLKKKRDEEIEKEIFHTESEAEIFETKLVKGLDDRLVISVHIRIQGYLQYTLDAQLDTRAMNSCAKNGALPAYYWLPVDISFRAVKKTELKIKFIAPDFPIYIQEEKVLVNLYCFDTGVDILLGQYFVNKCLPLTVGNNYVQLTILGNTLKIPSKSTYETRIAIK
jgi:hypothetical protein